MDSAEAKIYAVLIAGGGLESIMERALADVVAKIIEDLVPIAESAGLSEVQARVTLRAIVRKLCRVLSGS